VEDFVAKEHREEKKEADIEGAMQETYVVIYIILEALAMDVGYSRKRNFAQTPAAVFVLIG
jgi:hypothetical protein